MADGKPLPFKIPPKPASPEELVTILGQMSPTERDYAAQIIAVFLEGEHRLYDLVKRAVDKLEPR